MQNRTLFVENVSLADVMQGNHIDPKAQPTSLIRILDPGAKFERVKFHDWFADYSHFFFEDTDDLDNPKKINQWQVEEIGDRIRHAHRNNFNIVVHCTAGLCRSGAIADVCMQVGFSPVEGMQRMPNTLVRKLLMQEFGLAFDPNVSAFNLTHLHQNFE